MTDLHTLTAATPGLPCRTDPDRWYSDRAHDREDAVHACRACPLLLPCATYALEQQEAFGVWGATTAADRRAFGTGQAWRFDDAGRLRLLCGSERAYRAHFAYREQPGPACTGGGDCLAAHEEHITARRRAQLEVEHAAGGSVAGWWQHRRLGEPPCEACQEKFRAKERAVKATQRGRGRAQRGRTRPRAVPAAPGAGDAGSGALTAVQPLSECA